MAKRKVKKAQKRVKGKRSRGASKKGKHSKVRKLIRMAKSGVKKHTARHSKMIGKQVARVQSIFKKKKKRR